MYLKPFGRTYFSLLKWYGVLGNHDYRGTIAAQTALSEGALSGMERFILPVSRYYDQRFDGAYGDDKVTVHVFFVDTTPLVPKYYEDKSMMNSPDGLPIYQKDKDTNIEKQMQWLRRGLEQSAADYKVVVGHHTIYTSGHHKGEDGGNMERLIRPIMEDCGVIACPFRSIFHSLLSPRFPFSSCLASDLSLPIKTLFGDVIRLRQ